MLGTDAATQDITEFADFGGCQPSNSFSKVFSDVAAALRHNPKGNIVDPKCTGSTGTIPLTILSNMPDIITHYCQLIRKAQHEILLATNVWKNSESVKAIGNALRELSRKAMERGQAEKVVVKIMFLMFNPKLVLHNHIILSDQEVQSDKIGLPNPKELAGIDLQVAVHHNLPLGTLHSKFMVVDGRVAVIGSNNIQDNANLELSCTFQGPIVPNIRMVFLKTWYPDVDDHNGTILSAATPEWPTEEEWNSFAGEILERWKAKTGELDLDVVTRNLNSTYSPTTHATDTSPSLTTRPFTPIHLTTTRQPIPIALINRAHFASPIDPSLSKHPSPQNTAFLSAVKNAREHVYIQTPDLNADYMVAGILEAARRGVECCLVLTAGYNDAGEMVPMQGGHGHNEKTVARMYVEVGEEFKQFLKIYWYVGRDMSAPMHATQRCRNSHVKLMIIDHTITIFGSGNQDVQSWYHSQEINVLVDSPSFAQSLLDLVNSNQNTFLYGLIDRADGIWKGEGGERMMGGYGPNAGIGGFVKAAVLTATGKSK
ncbi:hypothetical protein HDV00_003973 [Rhizophlyctis rosea]|nr:hypothetical protein HDV00_003973 [Rhizophlyctis rosea]